MSPAVIYCIFSKFIDENTILFFVRFGLKSAINLDILYWSSSACHTSIVKYACSQYCGNIFR